YTRARRQRIRDTDGVFTCIAPRLSLTGLNADGWVAARPGTERLVALGLAHAIVDGGMVHGSAAPHLRAIESAVAPYAPERVAGATGVDPETIRRVARRLTAAAPSL